MEQAFSALIEDLSQRGLLDSTLVMWMSDFGRTPHINKTAGRDHWPACYSAVLAGGGIKGGQVIGESDAIGAAPVAQPVTPADIHATVLTALGYDPKGTTFMTATAARCRSRRRSHQGLALGAVHAVPFLRIAQHSFRHRLRL
jgi:uncharacterized protein (DUF1501 family)